MTSKQRTAAHTDDIGRLWLDRAYQYAADIEAGRIPACKYVQLAVDRWHRDLKEGPQRGLFFSEDRAARFFRFVGKYCRHYQDKWRGQLIELGPWQCFIEANVHGWVREDGTRRFRTTYEDVARKNGKTTGKAAAGNYYLLGDGQSGAQVYSAATKREQAKEIFNAAAAMIEEDPRLRRMAASLRNEIRYPAGRGKFVPLSKDSKTMDGFNVSAGLVDELHAHKDRSIWGVLETGTAARSEPIMRGITTAGFDRNGFCYEFRGYAIQVLERAIENDAFFAIIYTLDDPEKWDDEAEWIKANPNLGVSVNIDGLRELARRAKDVPGDKVEFLTKHMNVWVYGEHAWMPMDKWHECRVDFDAITPWGHFTGSDLVGQTCYGGLDLAAVEDICAFYLAFPREGGRRRIIGRAYLPQEALERRLRKGDSTLEKFRDSGHLVVLPGAVIDYNWIKRDIELACERFDVRAIAFDRWNSSQLVTDLMEQDVPMVKFGQGFASMSAPTKELLRLVMTGQLEHNDPLLTWAISNVVVEVNPAGDVKPDKSKVSEKIDPAAATIMAIAMAMGPEENDDPGFQIL